MRDPLEPREERLFGSVAAKPIAERLLALPVALRIMRALPEVDVRLVGQRPRPRARARGYRV